MTTAAPISGFLRRVGYVVVLAAVLMAGAGCGTTMGDIPVPGVGVSGETVEIVAEFDDAVNLAQGAPVKVNGVDSGRVRSITVEDYTARVTLTVREAAELRRGATARLRYTTPLGEIFVDITNPERGPLLAADAVLTEERTATAPTVEDALASASLLINGGGLAQLQTVTEELNDVLAGNAGDIQELLRNANQFLTEANRTTASIDRVLDSLNSVSRTLAGREQLLNRVLEDVRPAARVLRRATPEFTALLDEVEKFSAVANQTARVTRDRLLALLSEVEPVLAEIAANRGRMNAMLRELTRGGAVLEKVTRGDYAPLSVDLDVLGAGLEGGAGGVIGGLIEVLGLEGLAEDLGIREDLDLPDGGLDLLGRPATGTGGSLASLTDGGGSRR